MEDISDSNAAVEPPKTEVSQAEATDETVPPKSSLIGKIRGMSPLAAGVIGVVTGAVLTGAVSFVVNMGGANAPDLAVEELAAAHKSCTASYGGSLVGMTLSDNGGTLTFDNKGNDDSQGVSVENIACILHALNTPDSITSHMAQTTSMDGRQTEQWDNYEVQWSYHPDRGMDGLIKVVEPKS